VCDNTWLVHSQPPPLDNATGKIFIQIVWKYSIEYFEGLLKTVDIYIRLKL